MAVSTILTKALSRAVNSAGTKVRMRYYSPAFVGSPSPYDDDMVWTQSGADLWTSGVVLQVDAITGNSDSILVQQGKLLADDVRLFTVGSLMYTGSTLQVKVQIGSPTGNQYSIIPLGAETAEAQATSVYKKTYLRRLTNGSIFGE